ncbi:DUF4258 domain-containing protein [Faecalibacterium sp. An58]|uniref:DUF4258 domain-containing protein n=1 Tax=Faecalibacterium sp. An58 TaxID=1965648 RepID=UPI001181D068|nr:DUF4258 domain-containing protein [Faecalibacterium sp. An58]
MEPSSPYAPVKFTKVYLPQIRLLAKNREPTLSYHATFQMIDRGISLKNVQDVLKSSTNQVLEIQPPCPIPGRCHKDERILIFDPQYNMPLIVVCSIIFKDSIPTIHLVTAELVDNNIWTNSGLDDPALVRISGKEAH